MRYVKPLRELILELLEVEGPLYGYNIFKKLRNSGHLVKYSSVRWQLLFLNREGLIRAIPRGEAEFLGLQVTPDRSRRSGKRPPMDRRYYEIA